MDMQLWQVFDKDGKLFALEFVFSEEDIWNYNLERGEVRLGQLDAKYRRELILTHVDPKLAGIRA